MSTGEEYLLICTARIAMTWDKCIITSKLLLGYPGIAKYFVNFFLISTTTTLNKDSWTQNNDNNDFIPLKRINWTPLGRKMRAKPKPSRKKAC